MDESATKHNDFKPIKWLSGASLRSHLTRPFAVVAALVGLNGQPVKVNAGCAPAEMTAWVPGLALIAAGSLIVGAVAANASRTGSSWSVDLFYASIAWIVLPISARLASAALSRQERVALIVIATLALFVLRVIRAPIAFIDHDEFLHWLTTNDILEQGRLFTPNALLPVSPKFPGLEIVTTAIVQLTGLSVFGSALLLLATCRLLFICGLYLTFEKITTSPRVASLGCLIFMGASTFLIFDSHFSYESLAVVLLVLVLLSDLIADETPSRKWIVTGALTVPLLAALAATHHMTAFIAAGLFLGLAILEAIRSPISPNAGKTLVVSISALALPMIWSQVMGNPVGGYLGPVIKDGLYEATQLLSSSHGRELFVSEDGSVAPLWQRAAMIGSVVLICVGLVTGLLRSISYAGIKMIPATLSSIRLQRNWTNSRLILLCLLTFVFPLSILFRFTRSGWELGNRIGPFSFLGVSLVIAIGVTSFWLRNSRGSLRPVLFGSAVTVIIIGGVISSEGPRILVPARFHVSADSASIEPMGIAAAEWSGRWLGNENLFASDRVNRLLLATYGHQQVATTLRDPRDTSLAIQSKTLGPSEIGLLRQIGVDYVLADLRLTTGLPVVGVYFDGGASDRGHTRPLDGAALLKFNIDDRVSRPFDNGYQFVFDVRKLDVAR